MRRQLAVWLLVAVACGKSGGSAEPVHARRMFVSDAELDAMVKAYEQRVAANRTRSCERPPLRGDPLEGPADEHILAVPTRLDVCLGALSYRTEAVDAALFLDEELAEREAVRRVRPLDAPLADPETIAQLEAACDQLQPALVDAVSHRDACSPYLRGRGGVSDDLLWYPRLARPILVRARTFARAGRPVGASRILLDYLRLGQDLYRGGTSVLEAMVATAGMRLVLHQLQQLVFYELDRDQLLAIAGELEVLEKSEPGLADLFAGLPVDFASVEVLPRLSGQPTPGGAAVPDDLSDAQQEAGLVLSWIAFENIADQLAAGCTERSTDEQCMDAYSELMKQRAGTPRSLDPWKILQSDLTSVGPETRRQIVTVLETVTLEAHWKYFRRVAWRRAAIIALRWHALARAAWLDGKPCRPPGDLGVDTLGEALEARDGPGGFVSLKAPAWTDDGSELPSRHLLQVNCGLRPEQPSR